MSEIIWITVFLLIWVFWLGLLAGWLDVEIKDFIELESKRYLLAFSALLTLVIPLFFGIWYYLYLIPVIWLFLEYYGFVAKLLRGRFKLIEHLRISAISLLILFNINILTIVLLKIL
jgi:hypothetical protein